jgi:hypothetical protein
MKEKEETKTTRKNKADNRAETKTWECNNFWVKQQTF